MDTDPIRARLWSCSQESPLSSHYDWDLERWAAVVLGECRCYGCVYGNRCDKPVKDLTPEQAADELTRET